MKMTLKYNMSALLKLKYSFSVCYHAFQNGLNLTKICAKLIYCLFFWIPCYFPENEQHTNVTKQARFTEEKNTLKIANYNYLIG